MGKRGLTHQEDVDRAATRRLIAIDEELDRNPPPYVAHDLKAERERIVATKDAWNRSQLAHRGPQWIQRHKD